MVQTHGLCVRVRSAAHEAVVHHRQDLADYLNVELPPGESDMNSWTKGTDRAKVRREGPSLTYIARRPPHFASRLQVAKIVTNDMCMNEAFIHAIANKYRVHVVTFSPTPYGPHTRLCPWKYSPGFEEPNYHVTLADVKQLLSDDSPKSPMESTRFFLFQPPEGQTLGHFSYLRPLQPPAPPEAIALRSGGSAPGSTPRRNPKRAKAAIVGGGSPSRPIVTD